MKWWPLALMLAAACQCDRARVQTVEDAGGPVCDIEVCGNDRDDDCDGEVDEGCPCLKVSAACECVVGGPTLPCTTDVGACVAGQRTCSLEGRWGACVGGVGPTSETCNGVDDDCDGEVDEGLRRACGSNVGACREGAEACSAGAWGACENGVGPAPERCDGVVDDDCDGTVDEDCQCTENATERCGSAVGACREGTRSCTDAGVWASCAGDVGPSPEVCDHLDNDCNGAVDDPGTCQPPVVTCPAALTGVVNTPVTLTAQASDPDGTITSTAWTVAMNPFGSSATPTTPAALSTSFTPDLAGPYRLSFCATDDHALTTCCTTPLATSACASPPSPPVSTACTTSWDGRPIVQFALVPSGLRYELLGAGGTVLASATAGHNHLRPAMRIAAGGPAPGVAEALQVRACRQSDPTCCSAPTALTVNVVEACTTPTTPTPMNVLISEYVVNGEGTCPSADCMTMDTCQAGEAIEVTNLSNCPVSLDGFHFAYRNASATPSSLRWMNFGAADVVPPRGVYVAIRNRQYAPTCSASLGPDNPNLFGLRVSQLAMLGTNLCNGWFNNTGGGQSELRLAPGTIPAGSTPTFVPSAATSRISPYFTGSMACSSIGFDAVDSCGTVMGGSMPTGFLVPNQLGRLWHPCDAVSAPVPTCVRD
ncbi:MAG: hypothetical protein IAE78_13315 [Myxococcus sp.]|nr:hypothetical protein [Myxococcus sp.]